MIKQSPSTEVRKTLPPPGAARGERGFVMVTFVVLAVVLLGMTGLVIDAGMMAYEKRRAQVAADAAAMGGALEIAGGGNGVLAAADDATANGFTGGVNGTTVAVSSPPLSGGYTNDNRYVEVSITRQIPTTFMRILNIPTMTVSARSVAGQSQGSGGCIFALNPNSTQNAIVASGSAQINAQCGIKINSTNSKALVISGSACVTGSEIDIVGNYSNSSSCGPSPAPQTGQDSVADPLAYLTPPTVGPCDFVNSKPGNGTTVTPGVYCGGITVSGGATVHFSPGTYILLGGGLTVSSSNVDGTGVVFYNTADATHSFKAITVSGGSSTSLSAPTSGSLSGILFYEDRNYGSAGTKNTVSGTSAAGFEGAMYFRNSNLTYSGGSSGTAPYTIIVADTITFSGSSNIGKDYSSLSGGSPIKGGGSGVAE